MRSWLEEKGWLQGHFVSGTDLSLLKDKFEEIPNKDDIYLIVASQSCDICASPEIEKFIEFSIARKIEEIDGNYQFNKHPRKLHITANQDTQGNFTELYLELLADEKIRIEKDSIKAACEIEPDKHITLQQHTIQQYANWLASRYNRPALPTEFERRFHEQWNKSKREKDSGKLSEHILGIYVDILPDKEIEADKIYDVQLLFLVDPSYENNGDIKKLQEKYIENMQQAKMNVVHSLITTEKKISLATIKGYKRFYLDSLSYKNNHLVPNEFL